MKVIRDGKFATLKDGCNEFDIFVSETLRGKQVVIQGHGRVEMNYLQVGSLMRVFEEMVKENDIHL
jgi:hypothetical protein